MGNSINHTVALNLKNKGNTNVSRGDVVIIDKANADAFTVTGSQGYSNSTIGVVLDQVGITTGSSGMVTIEGYCPQVNLISGSNIGDTIFLSSVQQKAQSHSTILPGDFGQVLSTGTTPDVILWGNFQNGQDFLQSVYTGSTILMGLTGTVNYVDVDATNAAITFIPASSGKYKVTFQFSHGLTDNNGTSIYFRLTDGVTNSWGVFSNSHTNSFRATSITISYVFNWVGGVSQKVRLQKLVGSAITTANEIDSDVPNNIGLYMLVERL